MRYEPKSWQECLRSSKENEKYKPKLKGLVEQPVTLKGTGEFSFVSVLYQNKKAGEYKLELISGSTVEIGLDGFFIGSADDISNVNVVRTPIPFYSCNGSR